MTNKTLNLKASQALQSIGVDVESEKYWNTYFTHPSETHKTPYELLDSYREANGIPAYSFQELILSVLPVLGEKLGWKDVIEGSNGVTKEGLLRMISVCGSKSGTDKKTLDGLEIALRMDTVTGIKYHAHNLLDTLRDKGMEGVSKEITNLIEQK